LIASRTYHRPRRWYDLLRRNCARNRVLGVTGLIGRGAPLAIVVLPVVAIRQRGNR